MAFGAYDCNGSETVPSLPDDKAKNPFLVEIFETSLENVGFFPFSSENFESITFFAAIVFQITVFLQSFD